MKRIATLSLLLTFACAAAYAQDQPVKEVFTAPAKTDASSVPKQISGGVLNGKAISLPKPHYPPAARAVGASGAVSVQVLIDENGDVVSATAVSGHPLLRAASVEAARGAKFSPTQLMGNPVKVAGVITYNFVGPLYAARLGFTLSHAERTGTFGRFSMPASLASQLDADWIQEKEILNSLTFEKPVAEMKLHAQGKIDVTPPDTAAVPADTNRYTAIAVSSATSPDIGGRKLDAKSLSSLQSVIRFIEARMGVSESSAWNYELGSALGAFVAEIADESKYASNVSKIEALADRAPSTISPAAVRSVQAFVEAAKAANLSDEAREDLVTKAQMLSNRRY